MRLGLSGVPYSIMQFYVLAERFATPLASLSEPFPCLFPAFSKPHSLLDFIMFIHLHARSLGRQYPFPYRSFPFLDFSEEQ